MNWLVVSIVASVVLTIVLNLSARAFPGAGDRAARRVESGTPSEERQRPVGGRERSVKVLFPWKAMLVASLVLTILVNVAVRVT